MSGTSSSIKTKLRWNSHWMVLFQNGVRQLCSPAKMAATVQLRCYWKQLWSRWAITGSWEPLVFKFVKICNSFVLISMNYWGFLFNSSHGCLSNERTFMPIPSVHGNCLLSYLHFEHLQHVYKIATQSADKRTCCSTLSTQVYSFSKRHLNQTAY